MIRMKFGADMLCDEPNCVASWPVHVFLQASGGMAFKPAPSSEQWQIGVPSDNQGGPWICRCPTHKLEERIVQAVGAIPGIERTH